MKPMSMWVVLGMSLSIVFCAEIMAADNAQPVKNSTDAASVAGISQPTTSLSSTGPTITPPILPQMRITNTLLFNTTLLTKQPSETEFDAVSQDPTMRATPKELKSLTSSSDESIALMAH